MESSPRLVIETSWGKMIIQQSRASSVQALDGRSWRLVLSLAADSRASTTDVPGYRGCCRISRRFPDWPWAVSPTSTRLKPSSTTDDQQRIPSSDWPDPPGPGHASHQRPCIDASSGLPEPGVARSWSPLSACHSLSTPHGRGHFRQPRLSTAKPDRPGAATATEVGDRAPQSTTSRGT